MSVRFLFITTVQNAHVGGWKSFQLWNSEYSIQVGERKMYKYLAYHFSLTCEEAYLSLCNDEHRASWWMRVMRLLINHSKDPHVGGQKVPILVRAGNSVQAGENNFNIYLGVHLFSQWQRINLIFIRPWLDSLDGWESSFFLQNGELTLILVDGNLPFYELNIIPSKWGRESILFSLATAFLSQWKRITHAYISGTKNPLDGWESFRSLLQTQKTLMLVDGKFPFYKPYGIPSKWVRKTIELIIQAFFLTVEEDYAPVY